MQLSTLDIQSISVLAGVIISFLTLIIVMLQTIHLGRQTKMLTQNLQYSSYLKLLDYLNELNKLMINNERVKEAFEQVDSVKARMASKRDLSMEKMVAAWFIVNQYEAAFVGEKIGVLPEGEWAVWEKRLKDDLRIGFVRDVWADDVKSFDYDRGFLGLMNRLLNADEFQDTKKASKRKRSAGRAG